MQTPRTAAAATNCTQLTTNSFLVFAALSLRLLTQTGAPLDQVVWIEELTLTSCSRERERELCVAPCFGWVGREWDSALPFWPVLFSLHPNKDSRPSQPSSQWSAITSPSEVGSAGQAAAAVAAFMDFPTSRLFKKNQDNFQVLAVSKRRGLPTSVRKLCLPLSQGNNVEVVVDDEGGEGKSGQPRPSAGTHNEAVSHHATVWGRTRQTLADF